MAKRIITDPKFIVERDGDNWVLKFKDGNIYKPIEFNNAQLSCRKNMVISQPNFSIIDDKLFVNINGHDIKIGEVGDGYTLANKLTRNTIVEPNLDVVITSNGGVSVVTEIGGKNITINSGGNEPVIPTDRILYTVVEGGTQPTSTWITENCTENVFDANTGEGYLMLKTGVTRLYGVWDDRVNIFSDSLDDDSNITSVSIPQQITFIDQASMGYMLNLGNIYLSNGITQIGRGGSRGAAPFSNSNLLQSIILPESLTTIGYSFNNDIALSNITCKAVIPPEIIYEDVFENIGTNTLYVPAESITDYQNSNWANYFTTFLPIQE